MMKGMKVGGFIRTKKKEKVHDYFKISEYSCHGSWTENGTVYIIARHKGTKHGVCISYRPTEGTNAKLVVGDACYRGTEKPPEHHLEANLSVFGKFHSLHFFPYSLATTLNRFSKIYSEFQEMHN